MKTTYDMSTSFLSLFPHTLHNSLFKTNSLFRSQKKIYSLYYV